MSKRVRIETIEHGNMPQKQKCVVCEQESDRLISLFIRQGALELGKIDNICTTCDWRLWEYYKNLARG